MADPAGVNVAFDDAMLEPNPTWTRLDNIDNLVASYEIRRGRQDEFDRTGTGTAAISINDTEGLFDPTNLTSPYYGLLDGKQAALALHNPVTDTWSTIFRGFIDDYQATLDPSQVVTRVAVPLVDAFDYLAGVELEADNAGFIPAPPGSEGDIFYEETAGTVDDRINQALADAAWPTFAPPIGLAEIFSGNVRLQPTIYSAGESPLTVIQESAEAEFPGIANLYVSKEGVVTFHGRLARFDPDNPAYGITTWQLGDGTAILADPTNTVQIRALSWGRPRAKIVNSAFCSPFGIADADRSAQLVTDPTSIGQYGTHSWSAENLRIIESVLTGNDAKTECQLYSTYYITNYKDPRTRITQIAVKSLAPDDPRATAVWAFMCGVEISDIVHVTTTHPGGGGFDEDFFVEGITYRVSPLQPTYQNVELILNVSPRAYYEFDWVT